MKSAKLPPAKSRLTLSKQTLKNLTVKSGLQTGAGGSSMCKTLCQRISEALGGTCAHICAP